MRHHGWNDDPDHGNRDEQVNERLKDVMNELDEINAGNEPEKIYCPNGEFDNAAWLRAEKKELRQQAEPL
jgi:hypothetical protein